MRLEILCGCFEFIGLFCQVSTIVLAPMLARVVFVRKNNLCVSQNFLADICELLIILSVGLKLVSAR